MFNESQFGCADNYINQSPILYFIQPSIFITTWHGMADRIKRPRRVWPARRAMAAMPATLQVASKSQVNSTVATTDHLI